MDNIFYTFGMTSVPFKSIHFCQCRKKDKNQFSSNVAKDNSVLGFQRKKISNTFDRDVVWYHTITLSNKGSGGPKRTDRHTPI